MRRIEVVVNVDMPVIIIELHIIDIINVNDRIYASHELDYNTGQRNTPNSFSVPEHHENHCLVAMYRFQDLAKIFGVKIHHQMLLLTPGA